MHVLYEQWLSSGQSKAVFAKQHGLPTSTFYYWAGKFGKQASPPLCPEQQGGFSRLAIQEPLPVHGRQALVTFPSGVSVELYWPAGADFLKELAR